MPPAMRSAAGAESISQPVSNQGIRPAATPGAMIKKNALPRAASALRTGRRGLAGERLDQGGQSFRLVLRDEGVRVLDPLQSRALDGVREPLGEGELEEAVL